MSKYQEIFERHEKKYLLDEETYRLLMMRLQPYIQPDRFAKSTICNIYYDTPDHRLIRASLEKPVYKEKLRLRSYGEPTKDSTVFVELKKKYKGIVYKRRIDLPFSQAEKYLNQGRRRKNEGQIEHEIDRMFEFYPGLAPAMFLSYDRLAYCGIEDPKFRVTFDTRILWREEKLSLSEGVWGNPLLPEGRRIMEVKIGRGMPLWLAHILDELSIYPASFSKYGSAYQESQKKCSTNKEVNYCA